MNENAESAIDFDRVKTACSKLSEHFDTVQIFCTKMCDNQSDTKHYQKGSGNWFARFGFIKSFVCDIEKGYILGNDGAQEINRKEWE